MADDAVVESPWCVVCRRSSAIKWRKHVFARGHQVAAREFLSQQVALLQDLCDAATAKKDSNWWRCVFCDSAWATADALAHFSSASHRQHVEGFCRQHRCDADRQTRPQLWLEARRRREIETALAKTEDRGDEQQGQVEVAVNEHVEQFLTSAATRLQEVHHTTHKTNSKSVDVLTREQHQEALWGPHLVVANEAKRFQTVTSSEGVEQNPLGRHEGRRVWGGGIVKLRKAEWVPWAIDQLVKEEQAGQPEAQQAESAAFSHRVTELARGEGLSSIPSVSWGSSVGNVHTAAVPPWMVKSEEEYKHCNRREQAALLSPPEMTQTDEKDKKRRDIFSELQKSSEYGPGWLPNFGGVWQEGPRSKTKKAFRSAAKTSRDADLSRLTQASASQSSRFQTLAAVQRAMPTNLRAPSAPAPTPPQLLPPPPQTKTASKSVRGESQMQTQSESSHHKQAPLPVVPKPSENKDALNPLDAKKQLLLAQKERLRAKLAARRQR
ncbi:hypothetical protein PHYBOEH_009774 [Phytophthora boehmeriae]|uniref:Coiled-coil domain-containing protein 84 n=1 Tax=Phytophthora boehmeriae TaxID=109152 RepID=A0A8T1X1K5_9STRA|nr:hypothetical protein PHYBOEH_009774 [Phytophthora boehmeriae]